MVKTVADAGINHNGNIDNAFKLIDNAKSAGFDYVKFQKRNPDRYPERPYHSPVFGETTYREHKRRLEFNRAQYDAIDNYCYNVGIEWTASVFDFESVDFLMQYDPPFIKIPSPATLNLALVVYVAKQGKPVVMSTGMCEEAEIFFAMNMFEDENVPAENITILHCNSEYPTPIDHANLAYIAKLNDKWDVPIGYSSHDGNVAVPVQAVAYGAEMIEVHITLDRTMPGSDHAASLEYVGMETLVRHIRAVEIAHGKPEKIVYPGELKIKEKVAQSMANEPLSDDDRLRYLELDFNA